MLLFGIPAYREAISEAVKEKVPLLPIPVKVLLTPYAENTRVWVNDEEALDTDMLRLFPMVSCGVSGVLALGIVGRVIG